MIDLNKHISKNYFFEVLEKRLWEYEEAIFGTQKMPGMKQQTMSAMLYNSTKHREFDFIKDFIRGIQQLQLQDINAECIRKLKEDNKKDESLFRYWFQMCFTMQGYVAEPEPEKGNVRIDLKVSHSSIGNKIVEFNTRLDVSNCDYIIRSNRNEIALTIRRVKKEM